MARKIVIAVVGSGRENQPAVDKAWEAGRLVAENGWVLVTGGRNAGVMRAANEGARSAKDSLTIGILPDRDSEASPAVEVAIFTDTGEARNNIIVLSADVVIACGVDDAGTASEVSLALKNGKPVILLGAVDKAREFFLSIGDGLVDFAETPDEAVASAARILGSE